MRIENIVIPFNKRAVVSLTYIHGIGPHLSKVLLKRAEINEDKRIKDLSPDEENRLRLELSKAIEAREFSIEGRLRTTVKLNIKRLHEIKSYRGMRHHKRLPVRGQSTRQNARTWKGPRKTVANKKKATK